ncbi:SMI1/KNR4 family protein [Sinomicrobium pectinilyticum]|nr:SMI1/KNR4 family protein [Sinomicrobium pectinilyticum]
MWYDRLRFYDKQPGLTETPGADYFTKPLIAEEIKVWQMEELYSGFQADEKVNIPASLYLPKEFHKLLWYSNGGTIINGDREFDYFSLRGIRYFYFAYGFPKWAPCFLPIAFNGGGVFYAYDFRDTRHIHLVAASAGNLDYESAVFIGKTLTEVLGKTTNIEDELYV